MTNQGICVAGRWAARPARRQADEREPWLVFAPGTTHSAGIVVATPSALGLSVRCTCADGTKVVCAATAVVRDGLIVRELGVQAWDA